jgi:hypothetical protein
MWKDWKIRQSEIKTETSALGTTVQQLAVQ